MISTSESLMDTSCSSATRWLARAAVTGSLTVPRRPCRPCASEWKRAAFARGDADQSVATRVEGLNQIPLGLVLFGAQHQRRGRAASSAAPWRSRAAGPGARRCSVVAQSRARARSALLERRAVGRDRLLQPRRALCAAEVRARCRVLVVPVRARARGRPRARAVAATACFSRAVPLSRSPRSAARCRGCSASSPSRAHPLACALQPPVAATASPSRRSLAPRERAECRVPPVGAAQRDRSEVADNLVPVRSSPISRFASRIRASIRFRLPARCATSSAKSGAAMPSVLPVAACDGSGGALGYAQLAFSARATRTVGYSTKRTARPAPLI